MPKKIINLVVLLLVVAFAIYILYSTISAFIPRHGTVASVSALKKVYSNAGPTIAATFTNSLLQKFPFDGPIDWTLIRFKEPEIFLSGRVDTNALRQFISDHAGTRFVWSSAENELGEGWPDYPAMWTNISFNAAWIVGGRYEADIRGNIDFQTRMVTIRLYGSDGPVRPEK